MTIESSLSAGKLYAPSNGLLGGIDLDEIEVLNSF